MAISATFPRSITQNALVLEPAIKKESKARDFSKCNAATLFCKVYSIGLARIQLSCSCREGQKISLCGRLWLLTSGFFLLFPVVNTIVYLLMRLFSKKEAGKQEAASDKPKEIVLPPINTAKLPQQNDGMQQPNILEVPHPKETPQNSQSKEEGTSILPLHKRRMSMGEELMKKKSLLDCALKERSLPPLTHLDTLEMENGVVASRYGDLKVFSDPEIMEFHQPREEKKVYEFLNKPLYARITEEGTHLIQQQNRRGSGIAAVTMLLLDNGLAPDFSKLKLKNNNSAFLLQQMERHGLAARTHTLAKGKDPKAQCEELKSLIETGGRAIVFIRAGFGQKNAIIVDSISEETAKIRDPYHWWQVSISREALEKALFGGEIIQISG